MMRLKINVKRGLMIYNQYDIFEQKLNGIFKKLIKYENMK